MEQTSAYSREWLIVVDPSFVVEQNLKQKLLNSQETTTFNFDNDNDNVNDNEPKEGFSPVRIIPDGKDALYEGPEEEATPCPAKPGKKTRHLKGETVYRQVYERGNSKEMF